MFALIAVSFHFFIETFKKNKIIIDPQVYIVFEEIKKSQELKPNAKSIFALVEKVFRKSH